MRWLVQLAALVAIMIAPQFYGSLALFLTSFCEPVEPLSCGQSCCYLLLTRLQQPITMADLDQDFAKLKTESSFRELQRVLERHGVPTSSWKLDWDDVRSIRGPFIVHIDEPKSQFRHFHLAEWRGSELLVLDPLAARPIQVTTDSGLEAYRKAISGYVLVPNSGVPHSWQWRNQSKMATIVLATGVAVLWLFWHRRAVKSRSAA